MTSAHADSAPIAVNLASSVDILKMNLDRVGLQHFTVPKMYVIMLESESSILSLSPFFFLRIDLVVFHWLTWNLLCRAGQLQIQRDATIVAFLVMG